MKKAADWPWLGYTFFFSSMREFLQDVVQNNASVQRPQMGTGQLSA